MEDELKEESTFSFGEYISPTPKSIPLGTFKPEPSVTYKIKKIIKYDNERKEQSEDVPSGSVPPKKEEPIDSANECKPRVSFKEPAAKTKSALTAQPTPEKVKVRKQAKEIESLQAEIRRLQFENERLKSRSQSPQNEETQKNQENQAPPRGRSRRHDSGRSLSFHPSVDVVGASSTFGAVREAETPLHDKVSMVRTQRSATPFKIKRTRSSAQRTESKGAEAKVLSASVHHDQSRNQQRGKKAAAKTKGDAGSRGQYRITPIPAKKKKSTKFKSKLQSIQQAEKENMNISNLEALNDTAPTPRHFGKLKRCATPSGQNAKNSPPLKTESAQRAAAPSFDFGRDILESPSETLSESPSFFGGTSLGSSFLKDDTPEFLNRRFQRPGNGASNVVTPILTPPKGAEAADANHSRPFSFDWNKKK